MEIQIQDNYYLVTNKYAYRLAEKKYNKDDEPFFNYLKDKSTIGGVLHEYCELKIKELDATEFKEVIKKVEELKELIRDIKDKLEIEVD